MFGKIAAFEFRYQMRQPVFWVAGALFFLLTFGAIASDQVQIGDTANIHKNSPFNIAQLSLVLSLFFMFVSTAFVANVVLRDDETGYGAIVRATPMSKFDYLFGRFSGAFAAAALAFLFVPAGIWVGSLMPWVDPETLGPQNWAAYGWTYLVLDLPTLLVTSALFFAVATISRSMMATYLAVIGFLIAWTVTNAVTAAKPELRHVMALVDPLGFRAYADATRYWTAAERNSLMPDLSGVLLWNRLIDLGAGLGLLGLAYGLFQVAPRAAKPAAAGRLAALAAADAAPAPSTAPLPRPVFDSRAAWAQLAARTRLEMAQVFKSPAYLVLLGLGMGPCLINMLLANQFYGTPPYLVTRLAITAMQGGFTLFPLIIAVFYAGELVWRERERKTHEIIDATAVPDWAFVLPKTLAIFLVLVSTYLVSVVLAVTVQTLKGYHSYELDHYLVWYVLPGSVDAFLLAALAVFAQALAPHKYWGWAAMLVFVVTLSAFPQLGWEDFLYQYSGSPNVPLSDMNAQGDFWIAATWFRAYWTACALVLLVLSYGLWRRGTESRFGPRLRRLPHRLASGAGVIGAAALVAFVAIGGFIFLNTHVWNVFRTRIDNEKRQAAYEKALLRYENLPQPAITDVTLAVQLFPHEHRLFATGAYRLKNRTSKPISELHVRETLDTELVSVTIPGARLVKSYPQFNYAIYRFDQPLAPGASASLSFTARFGHRGFRNINTPTGLEEGGMVVDNGSFVNANLFAPMIGMNRQGLLTDRTKRRKYGLPPELRMAKLEDVSARDKNLMGSETDLVNSDISVTTDADQTPIAPGYKIADRTENGRRTARFKSDAPIMDFFSIQSARYAEKHDLYKGVDIGVYYHPPHPYNVDRMIAASKASLDYYQANFGPYQFHQLRFIEFPDYASFAQSFANTVPWSESLGFIADLRDPSKIDYVTYVAAHEIGHQWWGHQLMGANVQGVTATDETLAQYSALMVMEKLYGPDKIRRFLKYELDSYLRSRGGERLEELPLERVEDQPYIHYRKGALVMYLIKDQIGEAAVNRALRSLLAQYAYKGAPYPTAKALVDALRAQAPADKQALISDLFERITLYDVKATKVLVTPRADGRFDVKLTVEAHKAYADGQGKETPTPIAGESFDLGLFTAKPGEGAFGKANVIQFERRPLRTGVQTFDFVVAKRPLWVGVDPYNKWIDRNSDDNLIQVDKAG